MDQGIPLGLWCIPMGVMGDSKGISWAPIGFGMASNGIPLDVWGFRWGSMWLPSLLHKNPRGIPAESIWIPVDSIGIPEGFRMDSVPFCIGIPVGFRGIPGASGGFRTESPGGFHLCQWLIRLLKNRTPGGIPCRRKDFNMCLRIPKS